MSVEGSMASGATDDETPPLELGRAAGVPLYAQIRDALRQQIDSHSLPPGAPLPTEEALQARFGVSRSVVRQALGDLADLGLVVRQRGRGSVRGRRAGPVAAPAVGRRPRRAGRALSRVRRLTDPGCVPQPLYCSTSSRLRTLPDGPSGNASVKITRRGYL